MELKTFQELVLTFVCHAKEKNSLIGPYYLVVSFHLNAMGCIFNLKNAHSKYQTANWL